MTRNLAKEAAALLEELGPFARRVERARDGARPGSCEKRLLETWRQILEDIRYRVVPLAVASRANPDDQEQLSLLLEDWRHVRIPRPDRARPERYGVTLIDGFEDQDPGASCEGNGSDQLPR